MIMKTLPPFRGVEPFAIMETQPGQAARRVHGRSLYCPGAVRC